MVKTALPLFALLALLLPASQAMAGGAAVAHRNRGQDSQSSDDVDSVKHAPPPPAYSPPPRHEAPPPAHTSPPPRHDGPSHPPPVVNTNDHRGSYEHRGDNDHRGNYEHRGDNDHRPDYDHRSDYYRYRTYDHDRYRYYTPPPRYYYRPSPPVYVGASLPGGSIVVTVGGERYWYGRSGYWYRHGPAGYIVVRPPHHAIVRSLPPACTIVHFGGHRYYYWDDIYYAPVAAGYMILYSDDLASYRYSTSAPVVEQAPAPDISAGGFTSFWIDSYEYFFKDGQFYRKTSSGLQRIDPPLGALTTSLPEGAQSIWYGDQQYYVIDDVYLRTSKDGYIVTVAPWTINAPPAAEVSAPADQPASVPTTPPPVQ